MNIWQKIFKSVSCNQIFTLTICLFCILNISPILAQNITLDRSNSYRVLILHSYHDGFTWSDSVTEGIRSVFNQYSNEVELKIEYLDTRFLASDEYFMDVKDAIKTKYKNKKIDVIISCDDHALNFLKTHGKDIFSDTPIVFCSVSGYNPEMRSKFNLTGLQETLDIIGTMNLALRLHPQTKEIAVILDRSRTGSKLREKTQKALNKLSGNIQIRYLDDLTPEKLKTKLPQLSKNTIVLLFIFRQDELGRAFSHEQILENLHNFCPVPIYSVWQFYLDHGIIGGNLVNGNEEGRMAAQLALRILNGESPKAIPLGASPIRTMFDYNILLKFDVDLNELPDDAIVINKPISFYQQNKILIWGTVTIFILLTIALLSLLFGLINSRKAKKEVQKSERKFRTLFESSMDAILILDPRKGFLDCNPATLNLFGVDPKSMFFDLSSSDLSPEHQPDGILSAVKASNMIKKALEKGSNLFEWRHKRITGEEFDTSILLTRIEIDDRPVLLGTIRDISTIKQAQEVMIQSEKMMSVGGLAAGMAHEVNNPLAGIMQNAEVMVRRLTDTELQTNITVAEEMGLKMEDIRSFMEKRDVLKMTTAIKESGIRMAKTIENMLGFARKSDAEVSSHSITDLLDKTIQIAGTDFDLKKHYDFKSIKIEKRYDDVPMILCEAPKLQQVFLNILKNGSQAMQEAGTKNPRFLLKVWLDEITQMVCVVIKDNGPGMGKDIQKRIFEPFFTTKGVGVGTGLGLSVSYFIITEDHKGQIEVTSEPGNGAQFTIRLNA